MQFPAIMPNSFAWKKLVQTCESQTLLTSALKIIIKGLEPANMISRQVYLMGPDHPGGFPEEADYEAFCPPWGTSSYRPDSMSE